MRRAIWLVLVGVLALIFWYVSRYWPWRLWDRDGLFGFEALRPQGGLLGVWLRGTPLQPFELLIWAVGVFLVLTLLQRAWDLLHNKD